MPIILIIGLTSLVQAQSGLDWSKDTLSKTDAIGARDTYLNTVRGSGQKATARINLPVEKVKAIMDACYAKNITEISVMIVTLRPSDIARYKRNNPQTTATDEQIRGSQLIVFKVPRRAFAGTLKAGNLSKNPTAMALTNLGLYLLNDPYGLPDTDDVYFGFGTICPPPTSCD